MANRKDSLHQQKKTLTVFATSKASPLKYPDLLTYCYRVDQHRYENVPSIRRTSKATGLREPTVASATDRLTQLGLVQPDGSVVTRCPHLDWFVPLDSLKEQNPHGPEFRWLQNWKSLVRQPGADNPLTVPCVMLYSLIRHSLHNNWKPSGGWTHEYLALLTASNPKTVSAALTKLEEHGFLTILDGMRFRLFQLREGQLACFADRAVWSGNSSEPDELVEDFGPGSEVLEQQRQVRLEFEKYMERWPIQTASKQRIISAVMSHEGWEEHWRDWAFQMVSRVMENPNA